jgi:hypothetical protein
MVPPAINELVNALAEYLSAMDDYPLRIKPPDIKIWKENSDISPIRKKPPKGLYPWRLQIGNF